MVKKKRRRFDVSLSSVSTQDKTRQDSIYSIYSIYSKQTITVRTKKIKIKCSHEGVTYRFYELGPFGVYSGLNLLISNIAVFMTNFKVFGNVVKSREMGF